MSWVDYIHLNPIHTILSLIVIFGRIQVNMEKTDKQMCIGGKKKIWVLCNKPNKELIFSVHPRD